MTVTYDTRDIENVAWPFKTNSSLVLFFKICVFLAVRFSSRSKGLLFFEVWLPTAVPPPAAEHRLRVAGLHSWWMGPQLWLPGLEPQAQ